MKRSPWQRSLFRDGWPSWSTCSEQQRQRVVELLAELLVEHLDRLRPARRPEQPKPRKEPADA